ncbi:helix-turn-helix transcriptional regulator [Pseudolactococcus raffinolactis]|uniref:helix-turn-helix domain-containing protein n=1 Tax=Pseudolactococcus raffinolactis TaxID=1366 RepID=UPI0014370115|nr:helix-turn-helix transcriptional regulator [Lactococcus raffinolactis]QIW55279.1 helix-turn-helix transcriptional regulator [Lactococcus raffinolactis]
MFYERLKSLALEKNLSLNQVEKNLKLSRNTLANYKKGQTPSTERAILLANFFNVSTDYILGNTDIKSKNLETDLNKTLDTVKSFDGKPITDSDRETIREILKRRQREREQKENK